LANVEFHDLCFDSQPFLLGKHAPPAIDILLRGSYWINRLFDAAASNTSLFGGDACIRRHDTRYSVIPAHAGISFDARIGFHS